MPGGEVDGVGTEQPLLLGPIYKLNLPYVERALRGEPQEFEREIPDPAGGRSVRIRAEVTAPQTPIKNRRA